jgi:hypothetical protein
MPKKIKEDFIKLRGGRATKVHQPKKGGKYQRQREKNAAKENIDAETGPRDAQKGNR